MSESAFERSLAKVLFSLRAFTLRHDRFVVIGLLFSFFPLPPACFIGLLLSVINTWFLGTGQLGRQERGVVWLSLILSTVNSLLAVALIIFGYRYFLRLDVFVLPGEIMEWLQVMLQKWSPGLSENGSGVVLI